MRKTFTPILSYLLLPLLTLPYSSWGQNEKVKDIVISESTFEKLTNPKVNHFKLARIADKENGRQLRKDDPHGRFHFEERMLVDPKTGKIPTNIRQKELQFIANHASQFEPRLKSGGLSWQKRGPYNVGGRTRALAIDKTNSNIILAGGVTGGMWRSEDGGKTWLKTTGSDEHQSVTSVAQDTRDGHTDTWYYSTGEYSGSASAGGAFYSGVGVYKSIDNGKSWSKLTSTDRNETPEFSEYFDICWKICVDPKNGNVYLATYGGIYRSLNGGTSWELVLNSDPNSQRKYANYTDVHITTDGVIYACLSSNGETNGIFRSITGNGNEWTEITPSNFPKTYSRMLIASSENAPNQIYLLAQTDGAGFQDHSLWKLTWKENEDPVWENRSNNIPARKDDEDRDVSGFDSQNSYNLLLAVAPNNPEMVFIGGTNLFRSDDAFASKEKTYWIGGYATENNVSGYENHHADQHALAFVNDTILISGHDGGLSKTNHYNGKDEGGQPVKWEVLNKGYYTTQAYTVAMDENDMTSDEVLSGFQDNGMWYTHKVDATANWYKFGSGDGSYGSLINSQNSFINSSQRGTTYLNKYDAEQKKWTWTRLDPDGVSPDDLKFINPFIIDANNEQVMYFAGGKHIWRNSNIFDIPLLSDKPASKNWSKIEASETDGTIATLELTVTPANILYYATELGKIYKLSHVNTDQAIRTDITASNLPQGAYPNCIESDPQDGNKLLLCFSNYGIPSVFYSENGGSSWEDVSGNLEENVDGSGNGPSVRWVNLIHKPSGVLYLAGTSTGLYSTTQLDGANTQWTQESKDMIGNVVVSMVKTRQDGTILIGSHGNGIYSAKIDFSQTAPQADFAASQTTVAPGVGISFKDRSTGIAKSWNWNFEGAETTSSTEQHPSNIVYSKEGTYKVSLTVNNNNGAGEKTKEEYITVAKNTIVSINDKQLESTNNQFRIYPNPMRDKAHVEFPNPNQTVYRLIVVDASGRVVRIINNITDNNYTIQREQLKSGIHLINLQGEKSYKGKLLVK